MANLSAPDQIKRVVRTILLSSEFRSTWGLKIKRPFELVVSSGATGAELPVDQVLADPNAGDYWGSLLWNYGQAGHQLFEWPTPTGYPDLASYWASTKRHAARRWNLPYILTRPWGGNVALDLRAQTDAAVPGGSCVQIVDYWIGRLCGYAIDPAARQALIAFLAQSAQGGDPTRPPTNERRAKHRRADQPAPERHRAATGNLAGVPGALASVWCLVASVCALRDALLNITPRYSSEGAT